jgi:hypothetical protein
MHIFVDCCQQVIDFAPPLNSRIVRVAGPIATRVCTQISLQYATALIQDCNPSQLPLYYLLTCPPSRCSHQLGTTHGNKCKQVSNFKKPHENDFDTVCCVVSDSWGRQACVLVDKCARSVVVRSCVRGPALRTGMHRHLTKGRWQPTCQVRQTQRNQIAQCCTQTKKILHDEVPVRGVRGPQLSDGHS